MKKFVIKSKGLPEFLKVILGANQDGIEYDINERGLRIEFSELEAYRTGIPETRKALKNRECLLRSGYWNIDSDNPCISYLYDTSTKENLKIIDKGYKNGKEVKVYLSGETFLNLWGQLKVVFVDDSREPLLRFKKPYHTEDPYIVSISDFLGDMFDCKKIGYYLGTTFDTYAKTVRDLKKLLKIIVKC